LHMAYIRARPEETANVITWQPLIWKLWYVWSIKTCYTNSYSCVATQQGSVEKCVWVQLFPHYQVLLLNIVMEVLFSYGIASC